MKTVLAHHWNIAMKMLGNDLMRLLREHSLKLWERLVLTGLNLIDPVSTPLSEAVSGGVGIYKRHIFNSHLCINTHVK